MWISKRRLEENEKRVRGLESKAALLAANLDVLAKALMKRPLPEPEYIEVDRMPGDPSVAWCRRFYPYPLKDAVLDILKHLGLELRVEPGKDETVSIAKRPEPEPELEPEPETSCTELSAAEIAAKLREGLPQEHR